MTEVLAPGFIGVAWARISASGSNFRSHLIEGVPGETEMICSMVAKSVIEIVIFHVPSGRSGNT